MNTADNFIKSKLDDRRTAGNYRTLKAGAGLIDFCSNDYLGFARSAKLAAKVAVEILDCPLPLNGSTGSRLISGNLNYTEELEQQIAAFHQSEAGLLFNSGYDANVGLFSSIPQKGDTIIHDELIHASIIDGARLSHANRYTFRHNDPDSLEAKLKQAKGICYVVIESVYSMDGDSPPITALLKLTEQYGAHLIVDEAHAVGLYPAGLVATMGLADKIFARIVTFGKALGCHGAIVLGSNKLREYLINFARSFIYTTAAPLHQLAAVKMAYGLLSESKESIAALKFNINLFKQGLDVNQNQPLIASDSAIQCILLNSNDKARELSASLQQQGLDVRAILSPTVAKGAERIRICLHAYNTYEHIEKLTYVINTFGHAK
ncbi:aminotransferase class I/II-fold pyridoxal phosphate-dependent enzyme [Mucilaginibacter glaciei]|uniref:8-amino-7-oxononanoate synthase n=1 Tax=Mucilaginibacter glaciei TaxID=2772109 RepID=A0A926NME6_9SPHI|nr:8-amino-7-oxononanoate synthase [Mucilaginibacter glaciei]MBD1391893.1 8-amino-7-oxononanoate synthase [Mucilaginibacter glaciei]